MSETDGLCLNIGAGKSFIPGFRNIDISERAEIVLDLSKDALPFDESTVDVVFSYHTIEHVPNYTFAMGEIFRVLKDGGVFLMGVPYVTLTEFNLVNPYHVNHFNEHSFAFFDPTKLRGSAEEGGDIYFRKVFHRFHYMRGFKVMPPPFRGWCRRHMFNVVNRIDFGVVAVKSEGTLDRLPQASALRAQFDTCKRSRQFYDRATTPPPSLGRRAAHWWKGF